MRKNLLSAILIGAMAAFVLPAFSPVSAQTAGWKNWTWKRYRVKFKLPASWRVTKNNAGAFIAKGPNVVMKIGPWRSRSDTSVSVARKALNSYSIIKNKRVLRRKALRRGSSGLNRYMLYGKAKYNGRGRSNGKPVRFGIVGMTNPKSVVNLYVRMWWYEGKSNTSKNNRNTYKIATSFRAY